MRTLYCPIFEQGQFHENAITQKRGLSNALEAKGSTITWDYLTNDPKTLLDGFVQRMDYHHPDLVLTQFHAADLLHPDQIRELKTRYPETQFWNLTGDSWAWSLTAAPMLELAKAYDGWLCCAPDVLPVYAEHGINAHFWQIGFEPSVIPLPHMPTFDIVFMGNIISDRRRELRTFLRSLPYSVGIYGDGDGTDGANTYNFAAGESLYQNATLAIADCAYVDQSNYVSNRPLQILGAGGATLLHQYVPKMDLLLGIQADKHFVQWDDLDDLQSKIAEWLKSANAKKRKQFAVAGRKFVLQNHTWANRVEQLVGWLGDVV